MSDLNRLLILLFIRSKSRYLKNKKLEMKKKVGTATSKRVFRKTLQSTISLNPLFWLNVYTCYFILLRRNFSASHCSNFIRLYTS